MKSKITRPLLILLTTLSQSHAVASSWEFIQNTTVRQTTTIIQSQTQGESLQSVNMLVKKTGMNGRIKQTATFTGTTTLQQTQVNSGTQAVNTLNSR